MSSRLVWLAALLPAWAAAQSAPAPGRYQGELCVATRNAGNHCGPAEVTLRARGELRLRISDIVYRLTLKSSQLDLVLMHGTMQIDGFTARYEWVDRTLQFDDPDKPVRYRLRVDGALR